MFVCLHFLIKFGHILKRQRGKSLWSVSYLVSYFLSPHPKPTSQFSSWKLSLWKLDEKGLRKKCSKEEKETRKNAALTLILNQITFLFFQCNTFAEKQENGIRWYLKCAIIEVYENRYLERFFIEIFCICICISLNTTQFIPPIMQMCNRLNPQLAFCGKKTRWNPSCQDKKFKTLGGLLATKT